MFQTFVTGLTLVTAATAAIHSIEVGNGDIKFSPDSLTAELGDQLEFHFYSGFGNHSVVSSTFESPCVPATDAFFSGYVTGTSTGDPTFVVNVTSTDPIWFYCSLPSHCQSGMSGVVNPPSGQSISDYMKAAKMVASSSAPASEQGGTLTTITGSASTSMSSASTSMGSTSMATGAASSHTTMPSSSASTTASSTSSAGTTAATTKASSAGKVEDLSVMLGLGVISLGLVALMA